MRRRIAGSEAATEAALRLGRTGWAVLARTLGATRDVLVPARCPGCSRVVRQTALCGACWREVRWIAPPLCDRLGLPLSFEEDAGGVSLAARASPPPYARARAAALHEGAAARTVQALKYADRQDLAPMLGHWLARAAAELFEEADLVVPVPLHPWRRLRRGFNQSALLAHHAVLAHERAGGSRRDWEEALTRQRRTRPQVGLAGATRRRNVEGAFMVRPDAMARVAGRRILLIDDVVTTGATVEAATKALRKAGAAQIDVGSVTRVKLD